MERPWGHLGIGGCGWHPGDPREEAAQTLGSVGNGCLAVEGRAARSAVVAPRQPLGGRGGPELLARPPARRGNPGPGRGKRLRAALSQWPRSRAHRPGARRPSEPTLGSAPRPVPFPVFSHSFQFGTRTASHEAKRGDRGLRLGDIRGCASCRDCDPRRFSVEVAGSERARG